MSRWSFRPRAVQESSHSFDALFRLVDAAVPPSQLLEFQRDLKREMDIEEWAGVFAVEHVVGNWDSFGYSRGKNMYAYRPERGPGGNWSYGGSPPRRFRRSDMAMPRLAGAIHCAAGLPTGKCRLSSK